MYQVGTTERKKNAVPINREQTKTEVKIKSHMTNERAKAQEKKHTQSIVKASKRASSI